MRIYMQTKYSQEQPLRFYHLHLQPDLLGGWMLIRETGLQGGSGKITREYFEQREAAEEKMIQRLDYQLSRGYQIVFREGTPRAAD
ncbi:MAG: WGR domain-containing protein [Gammaproteobacteria bacterium]|nr:WGR domain-containing protein [Gammaproteobacteria bacterium]